MTPSGSLRTNKSLTSVYQTEVLRILKQLHLLLPFKESSHWKEQVQRKIVMLRVHNSASFQMYFHCAEIKPVYSFIF